MKVLVTGGTGFIGSHVVNLIVANGHSIRLFSRAVEVPERLKGRDVSLFHGDLADPDSVIKAMDGMDVFFHIGEIKNTSLFAAESNVRLVEKIVGRLGESGIKRLVFVSSITVAGIPSKVPASEDTPPAAELQDQYTAYKRRCEEILLRKSSGLEYAIVRPGVVYGPRSKSLVRLLELFFRLSAVALPFIGNARNLMPLIHVKDLAKALCLAGVKREAANQTFNLTDGTRHTWLEFFSAIAQAFNKKLRILPLPPLLLRVPAVFADVVSRIVSIRGDLSHYVAYLSRDVYFDNNKAQTMLGWTPEYTDLTVGVKEMLG